MDQKVPSSAFHYGSQTIQSILEDSTSGIGTTIGLLWFRRPIPAPFARFMELCLVIYADHPHNTTSPSPGTDLVSSVASDLLGMRGDLDAAGMMLLDAVDQVSPEKLVSNRSVPIPGLVHCDSPPDSRLQIIQSYMQHHCTTTRYLSYFREVEAITMSHKDTRMLQVDGLVAASMLDWMVTCISLPEIRRLVKSGVLTGLFLVSRTIGAVGRQIPRVETSHHVKC